MIKILNYFFGSLFFLFIPGYLFTRLIFNKLSIIEKIAFSIGFSIIINLFIGLILGMLGKLNSINLWISILLISFFILTLIIYNNLKNKKITN